MKRKMKGFTLIELISVLVIMAIIALIVTPLVMNIIRKARISADKRSVDAYGRSIELAIASYLLDTGKFPTEVSQLTIEYSGDTVTCETTQINPDSSVYLAECTVKNRNVDGYSYGTDKSPSYTTYKIGDEVTYNEVDYYVIKDSGMKESTVTLLMTEPLSYEDVQTYSEKIGEPVNNHNGYGTIRYHSSSNNYATSFVKTVVDVWAQEKVPSGLQEARLITYEEVKDNFGYELGMSNPSTEAWMPSEYTPSWIYSNNYSYWTMSLVNDSVSEVWIVSGYISELSLDSNDQNAIRPVIVLDKSVLSN